MNLRKNVYIETHENVTIEYETANLGSRFLAHLLDNIIIIGTIFIIGVFLLLTLLENKANDIFNLFDSWNILYALALIYIVVFVLKYFYFVFFEMVLKGQSPGKKATQIRVVSTTGEPVSLLSSLIRNLFRVADDFPANYLVGCLFIVINKKSQRLGDIVANTMVIKTKKDTKFTKKLEQMLQDEQNKEVDMQEVLDKYLQETEDNTPFEEAAYANATISKNEYEILNEYLRQREYMPDANIIDVKLFNYFFRRVNAQIPKRMYYSYVIQFLRGVEKYNSQFYNNL